MSQTVLVALEGEGLRHYPADLNPDVPGADYGNVLARLFNALDAVAKAQGLSPLGTFVYTDPELLLPLLDDLEGAARARIESTLASQSEWHSAGDALSTVESLLALLEVPGAKDDPALASLRLGGSLEPLVWDLRAIRHLLRESTTRFHLEAL